MGHDQVNLETFLDDLGQPQPGASPGGTSGGQRPGPGGPPDAAAPTEDAPYEHPLVKPGAVEARPYQTELARLAAERSSLIVVPTGLGKTIIALMAVADVLERARSAHDHAGDDARHDAPDKVLFLAPTRPLVQQHAETFRDLLLVDDQVELAGSIAPAKRVQLFEENRVVFSTPQGLRNDVREGRTDLSDVAMIVFDEAHRATGDYAYVDLAIRLHADSPDALVLGLTASPGGDEARIEEVVENLGIERIEARDTASPDVAPYVKDTSVRWVKVPLDQETLVLRQRLQEIVDERARPLKNARLLPPKPYVSRKDLVQAGNRIRAQLGQAQPHQKGALFGMLLNQGVVMQALHALELLETQGMSPLRDFIERAMKEPKNRSAKAFAGDDRVAEVLARVKQWRKPSHPKLAALGRILEKELSEHPDSLVIVFAQYRDTISSILKALDVVGIRAEKFVGQADRTGDKGMSQDEQRAVLDRLRASEFQVLVASSVAEEGLDIPRVDLVVFYEPVPSEIRLIQRRGRTGRHSIGRVAVLIAEDTRDEAFMFAAMNREKKMRRIVRDMR